MGKVIQYKYNKEQKDRLKGRQDYFVFPIKEAIEYIDNITGGKFNAKHYAPLVHESIPTLERGTIAHDDFWDLHDKRCIKGYAPIIDGVEYPRITGPHYFYLNMFQIMMLNFGERKKRLSSPYYRVLDHMIFLELEKAEKDGYGLIVGKARRMGLSYIGSVMILWNMLFFKDNAVGVGAGKEDKAKLLFDKVIKSLQSIREEYHVSYKKTKDSLRLTYGVTDRGVRKDKGIGSTLDVKTFFSDASALEGGSYSLVIFEEIGLHDNLIKSYKATEPAFTEGQIQFGVPFLFGCVCAGTKVWNNKGQLRNIEDLHQDEGILGYNGNEVSKEPIVWMQPTAFKPCYEIKTIGGNFIRCSNDHPLMWSNRNYRGSYNKKKTTFKLAEDIKVGDQLMILNEVSVFGDEEIKDARLLGLLIGDGNYTKGATPQLSCGDKEIGDYVKNNYSCKTYKSHIKKEGGIYETIGIHNFQKTLIKHGIYGQVKLNKRLPLDIHTFNKKSLSELIGGYFDADGSIHYNKKKNSLSIVLSSICKELLIEVKYTLLKLGIGSSISKNNRNIKPSKGYENQLPFIYRLSVNRMDDVLRFQKEISFLCKKKQTKLNSILKLKKQKNNIKLNSCEFILSDNEKGKYFEGNTDLKLLRSERVSSIEYIGMQEIYNLNAGGTHTYLSNAIVSANTGAEVDKGSRDFKIMYGNPGGYNLKKLFIPKYMYYPGGLGSDDDKAEVDDDANFFDIRTGINDEDAALKHILKRRNLARKSKEGYIKEVQSNPIKESDIFLKTSGGILDRIALSAQKEAIYNKENAYQYVRGVYRWNDPDFLQQSLARCINSKERNLLRLNNNVSVSFIEDDNGSIYHLKGITPINNENMPYNPDIMATDSYDEERVVESGSLGAGMVYRCFNGFSKDYNLPVAYLLERGDGSSEDVFFENNLMMAIHWNAENLIEYTKIAIMTYYKDVNAFKYLRENPTLNKDIVTNRGQQEYGVRMTSGSKGFKNLVTTLLKIEVKENVHHIHFDKVIDDLIEYGDGNTDLAMTYGIILIHKLDLFAYISDDLDSKVEEADILMDMAHYTTDAYGNLSIETYSNKKEEIDIFDPRIHLQGEEREKYLNFVKLNKDKELQERKKNEENMKEHNLDFDIFESQVNEMINK